MRLKDQVAIRGEEKEIDQVVRDWGTLKSKKVKYQNKIHKDTYIYQLEESEDEDEDPATEMSEDLKTESKIHFSSPVFYDNQSGLRVILTDELVVKLKEGYTQDDLLAINPPYIQIKKTLFFTKDEFILIITDAKENNSLKIAQWYTDQEIIEWAVPNFMSEIRFYWEPNDPSFDLQWHLKNTGQQGSDPNADVDANQAWDLTTGDPNIVVAIINSGVQTDHPDLADNIWFNPNEISGIAGIDDDNNGCVDDINGWNFYDHSSIVDPIEPEDNHGTSCAGVVAACNNTVGGVGIAPGVKILPIKISTGLNWAIDSDVADAFHYAAQYADILSCSWGGPLESPIIHEAIQDATDQGRGGKGCPVFIASGNYATGFKKISYRWDMSPEYILLPPGNHTYRWVYTKNPLYSFGEDSVWIDRVIFPNGEIEDFAGGIPDGWVTATGNNYYPPFMWYGWYSEDDHKHYFEGADVRSVKSGDIGNNQYTYLDVTKTNYDWGDMQFFLWTSTEPGADDFEFYIDGVMVYHWSGMSVDNYQEQVSYPAAYDEAIAVGASTNFNYRSFYSQYGAALDFVAPSNGGTLGIYTTDRTGGYGYSPDNYTDYFGGTSAACPLAAGIAALLLSREPDLTSAQVRQRLRDTADEIGPVSYVNGRNNYFGYGKVNAYKGIGNK